MTSDHSLPTTTTRQHKEDKIKFSSSIDGHQINLRTWHHQFIVKQWGIYVKVME